MVEYFLDGLKRILSFFTLEVYVLAFNGAIFLLFVIFLFTDKRKLYPHLCFIIVAIETAVFNALELIGIDVILPLSCALSGIFYLVLKIPKAKKKRVEMTAQQFVKSLDMKLKEGDAYRPEPVMQEKDIPLPILDNNLNSVKKGLNVSHARSIIEKLNFMDLSPADKLKVSEISEALCGLEKESGASSFFKVNEKLSSLIKILAKYQV